MSEREFSLEKTGEQLSESLESSQKQTVVEEQHSSRHDSDIEESIESESLPDADGTGVVPEAETQIEVLGGEVGSLLEEVNQNNQEQELDPEIELALLSSIKDESGVVAEPEITPEVVTEVEAEAEDSDGLVESMIREQKESSKPKPPPLKTEGLDNDEVVLSSRRSNLVDRDSARKLNRQASYLDLGGKDDEFGVSIQVDLCEKYCHVEDQMTNLIKNLAVRRSDYLKMVLSLMEIIEENEELSGEDKSDLVIHFTGKVAKKFNLFDSKEELIMFLRALPNLFAVVTQMTKGELTIFPTKAEEKRKKKMVNVITYSVYEEAQRFVAEHELKPDVVVVTAPQIIFEITKAVECYTYLRQLEKDMIVNKVIDLFIENFSKMFPRASTETIERLSFTFMQMESLSQTYRAVQNREFCINNVGAVTLNRAPDQIHRTKMTTCLPWLCK